MAVFASLATMIVVVLADAWTYTSRASLYSMYPSAGTAIDAVLLTLAFVTCACFPAWVPAMWAVFSTLVILFKIAVRNRPVHHRDQTAPSRAPWLTSLRALMMLLTCVVILAVDFPIFPKASAKSEKYGFSLMDMGVGTMTFAAGFSTGPKYRWQPRALWTTVLVMTVLGFLRLMATKAVDYHEQVIEYGVHWNFFFTLAAVHLMHKVFEACDRLDESCWAILLVAGAITNHLLLYHAGFEDFVFNGPRTTFFSQNREGIIGLLGFSLIFELAYRAGDVFLLCSDDALRFIPRWIVGMAIALLASLQTGVPPSRRLVNLPFVFAVLLVSFIMVGALNLIVKHFRPYSPSRVLEALNARGLEVFLVANVLTGLVNLTLDTSSVGPLATVLILTTYGCILIAVACTLERSKFRIRRVFSQDQASRDASSPKIQPRKLEFTTPPPSNTSFSYSDMTSPRRKPFSSRLQLD
eukprot:m.165093 g.165093  ORF g.165093 m.165093 type:complete len:467 (-) comp16421_c2_seq4:154-1554(-)